MTVLAGATGNLPPPGWIIIDSPQFTESVSTGATGSFFSGNLQSSQTLEVPWTGHNGFDPFFLATASPARPSSARLPDRWKPAPWPRTRHVWSTPIN